MTTPDKALPFEYATLRVVPRVDLEEFFNVGVVLYCQLGDFLSCQIRLDPARLRCGFPGVDVDAIRDALDATRRMCVGGEQSGQARHLSQGERFRWLTAPRSTVVQPSPVHSGMTHDPARELARLLRRLMDPID